MDIFEIFSPEGVIFWELFASYSCYDKTYGHKQDLSGRCAAARAQGH